MALIPNVSTCALASDELRSHIENFSHIQRDIQDLRQGLIFLREFASAVREPPSTKDLVTLAERSFEQLTQVRRDLRYLGDTTPRDEIPVDLRELARDLRLKRPHSAPDRQLDSTLSQIVPRCSKVISQLEYVIRVYEMDLNSFPVKPGEVWYQHIQTNSLRRVKTAREAIETLQDITRNSIMTSR